MSFSEVIKRMLQGQPAFVSGDNEKQTSTQPQPDAPPEGIRKNDQNSFPAVYVKHTKTNIRGDDMEVHCRVVNTWPEQVFVDKIHIGGKVKELDTFISGGEEEELLVYSGDRFKRQEAEAHLDYKTQKEGDYFRAVHEVKYRYHAEDKTFSIAELRLKRPIRDIYG